jgi:hypothetical protein
MPGLVPGIHVFDQWRKQKDVDGRDTPGHDGVSSRDIVQSPPAGCGIRA